MNLPLKPKRKTNMAPVNRNTSIWAKLGRAITALLRDFVVACWEVLKLPFILIGIGFQRFFGLGARKVIIFIVAAVIVTFVASSAFIEATSQPGFCVSCHVMQPYFDAWRTSTHHNVSCVTCHVPPGVEGTIKHKFMAISMLANYATGLYKRSKPWAEIDDAACLRGGCHETRLLKSTENFKGVVFDHRPHLEKPRRDRHLRCTSCHAQIVQGEHISVTEGTCFLCHFKPDSTGRMTDLARCTHCHTPPTGPAAADTAFDHTSVLARHVDCLSCHATAVSGDGYVPPERCSSCHAKAEHIQRYGDQVFVHQMHVTEHKVECLQCHIAIRHGHNVAVEKDPTKQCAACHGLPDDAMGLVWRGELPGIARTPSAMARAGMSCSSCHAEPIHRSAGKYGVPACSPCHESSYDNLWRTWERPLRTAAEKLAGEASHLPPAERDTVLKALEIYQRGNPVHNPDLLAAMAAKITGAAAPLSGRCEVCHPAASHAIPIWNGRGIPHAIHAEKHVACETCHITDQPHHGQLTAAARACNDCHHKSAAADNCGTCHDYQTSVYKGTLSGVTGASPSPMAAADVACTDCHTIQNKTVVRINGDACVACHDASYADTLRAWQNQGDGLMKLADYRQRLMDQARSSNHDYQDLAAAMRHDGSRIVHNPFLFTQWAKRIEVTP
jgi:nitrate/TMAO reductase-like tetraheme cytochrome c subunit